MSTSTWTRVPRAVRGCSPPEDPVGGWPHRNAGADGIPVARAADGGWDRGAHAAETEREMSETMTTAGTTAMRATTMPEGGFWRRYGGRWAAVPRELASLIALVVLANVAFSVSWGLVTAGLGLLAAFLLGVFVLVAAFYVARGIGTADLAIVEWAGRPRIPRPEWPEAQGFAAWLKSIFGSSHYWRYLLHLLLPQFVVSVVTFVVGTVWLSIALGGTFWGVWSWSVRHLREDGPGGLARLFERWLGPDVDALALESVAFTILGLLFLFLLPYVSRGLTWAHWGVARLMLGGSRSEVLERELAVAQASRAAAVAAEDSALRRLERDIHDGPQQRLIRLQMDLASAERRIEESPDSARELLASASEQAREALDELRALSRGFAPPILLDRGLVAALESAAARSAVPTRLVAEIPEGFELRPALERGAYFIASEAMTNAVKHAAATAIQVRVAARADELVVEVVDDGRGGAEVIPGHGLAGLRDRVAGLGGRFELESPAGGPTRFAARLPW